MGIIDILTMAVRSLLKRKVRTALTVLGVTIGTASIVLMISLGIAANMNFERQLENFGDVLNIEIWHSNQTWNDTPRPFVLNNAVIDYIASWDGVEVVTPILEMWSLNAQIGRRTNDRIDIIGVRPEAMPFLPGFGDLAQGEFLQPGEGGMRALVGSEVPFGFMTEREREEYWRNMWGGGGSMIIVRPGMGFDDDEPDTRVPLVDIFTEQMLMSYVWGIFNAPAGGTGEVDPNVPVIVTNRNTQIYEIEVAGLLQGTTWQTRHALIMDIQTVMDLVNAQEQFQIGQGSTWVTETDFDLFGFNQAIVRATDINTAIEVFDRLYEMDFDWVSGQLGEIGSLRNMSDSLQNMLLIIGAVSMLVAIIGIANTMIMSIYERTKEIGVMKVIGAALSDIGRLFLVEAGLIGVLGGFVGLAASFGLSHFINNLDGGVAFLEALIPAGVDGYISYIPPWLYGLALGASAIIGLGAGFLPAMRAMRISALTAIRTD